MTEQTCAPPHSCYEPPSRTGDRHLAIDGEMWKVHEDRHGRWGPSLIFEAEKIARRVRDYPQHWRDLSDEELSAVSCHR